MRTIATLLIGTMSLALLAVPTASAGDSLYYNCQGGSGSYVCTGVGTSKNGEVCYVQWWDDDSNGDWEDENANVSGTTCGLADIIRP